jgi:putative protein-disulfide isomerase
MQAFERIVYFADPMCSWCYGFSPAISEFASAHSELPIALVMGGLRPYTKAPAPDKQKADIRNHWRHVEAASHLPFNDALLMKPGFIYDTEPACRAVATVRELNNQIEFNAAEPLVYLHAIQAAFYRDARDITKGDVLADIAYECGLDRDEFLASFNSTEMRELVKMDFELTKTLGISGFPALCAAQGNELHMIANGYAPISALEYNFAQLVSG